MRVGQRTLNDDRGAVGALVSVLIVALLGMSALVVDIGNLWQHRRNLTTATDASALAAAQEFALGGNGCGSVSNDYFSTNRPAGATVVSCTPTALGNGAGTVEVVGTVTVDYFFGDVVGVANGTVTSTTAAKFEQPSSVEGGLRPFGLCIDALPSFTLDDGVDYVIPYGKDAQPDACGGEDVPGNWGVIDFDGGSNPQSDIVDWTRNGYPGEVVLGQNYEGDTGAFSPSLANALDDLLAVECFSLPIFSVATGNGANAEFLIVDFATVSLTGFRVNGPQDDRYLQVRFQSCIVQGGGNGGGPDLGPRVLSICTVDRAGNGTC